jgi:hypothetical protein
LRAEWLCARYTLINRSLTRGKPLMDGWIERARNNDRFAKTYATGFD